MEGKERRRFNRLKVVVYCTVGWQDKTIRGRTLDLSYGGAFIATEANIVPPKGASVTVRFGFAEIKGDVEEELDSRIIRTIPEIAEEGRLASFGVKFTEPIQNVRDKLEPVFRTLALDQ
jgi:c-di-GMP-binding flagellar brake protein YcgR